MRILSIRQPYTWLIVAGHKPVENRTWNTLYRGPVLIHASQRREDISPDEIERRFGVRPPDDLPLGGIVGTTEIADCVRDHPSKWAEADRWHFVLANSRPLPFVRWKGALSLREAPGELIELLDFNQTAVSYIL